MSALAVNLRSGKSSRQAPMEAVVVNSIIYSKPSFCRIAVDLGDGPPLVSDNKPAKSSRLRSGNCPNNGIFQNETDFNNFCFANMSVPQPTADAKVYRICTTINGSIHHQISELCDNILTIAGLIGEVAKSDDEGLVNFGYREDDNLPIGDDFDSDDDDDDGDGEEDDYEDENLDEDDDVVDFSYGCSIERTSLLRCDEKKSEPTSSLGCDEKKSVSFNDTPTVHYMHTWSFARRAARKGEWEMYARDRERFRLRIHRAALILNPILEKEHRQKIYEKRFANVSDEEKTKGDRAEKLDIKETSVNKPKIVHQKKQRKKKRFCKMGNKHYF